MDGRINPWMDDGWMDGHSDAWMTDGLIDGWMDTCLVGWMHACMNKLLMDGWMDGWIDGYFWLDDGRTIKASKLSWTTAGPALPGADEDAEAASGGPSVLASGILV